MACRDDRNLHLRDLPSVRFKETRIPSEFREFAVANLLGRIPLTGYKISRKTEIAIQILNNLVLTGLCDYAVGDTRDEHQSEVQLRVRIWQLIEFAGLAVKCLGSEISGMRTRYAATRRLLRLFKGWHLAAMQDLNLGRNSELSVPTDHALVVLRKGTKDPATGKRLSVAEQKQLLPLPKKPFDVLKRLCKFEDQIEQVNRCNLKYAWAEFGTSALTGKPMIRPVNPCLRMIYSSRLWIGGRLYTWGPASGQALSKHRRQNVLIDSEPVAEFDFSAHALRMLYHRYAEFDPNRTQDLYRPETVLPRFYKSRHATPEACAVARDFVKRVTNACLNVSHRTRAKKAAEKAFADHEDFELLRKIIHSVERTSPSNVVERVWRLHPEVNSFFFSNVGRKLTRLECRLMLKILLRFAEAGMPVLGIHDALLVRKRDAHFARRAMKAEYRHLFGFDPVVKRDF